MSLRRKEISLLVMLISILVITAILSVIARMPADDSRHKENSNELTSQVRTSRFSIMAPENWKIIADQGIDGSIYFLQINNVNIMVETGPASDPLNYSEEDYVISYRHISNHMAKIVTPKEELGVTGIHFAQLPGDIKVTLSVINLLEDEKQLVLSMFNTIQITRPGSR